MQQLIDDVLETIFTIWWVVMYFVLSLGLGVALPVAVAYFTLRLLGAI